ncbi:hypothetical protein [Spongiactinospora rosea]|uniref:hypothetical protein n=1 Tax=Spongiactinospora rosea TaxID=2248750 RepID=UPI0011C06F68|nr:hypothetical protein [Spongiactinospora rosea]
MLTLLYFTAGGVSAFCDFNEKKQLAVIAGAMNDSLPKKWVTVERYEGAGCEPPDSGSSDQPELSTLHMRLVAKVDLQEVVDTMKAHQWMPTTREEADWYGIDSAGTGGTILVKDMNGQRVYALLTARKTIELSV